MSIEKTTKGNVMVYACGGGGMNIGSLLEGHRGNSEVGFANLNISYVDTSLSNMRNTIKAENCFILEGVDGSGQVRKENHEQIANNIKAILHKFKPADLNIVISTASGGSGSVIAPLITSELLANDYPTIVITIGSTDTRLFAENTLNTIKSYEGISRMRKKPIVAFYAENGKTASRTQVDNEVCQTVISLCMLYSRENREMDTKDLFNWLHYDKTTSFPAQLSSLIVFKENTNADVGNVISVATLASANSITNYASMPEYQCVGYLPETITPSLLEQTPVHFVVCDGIFSQVASNLQKLLREVELAQGARSQRGTILGTTDVVSSSGLIL
jgi:hypothetical protein